jgi:hypothetical protein
VHNAGHLNLISSESGRIIDYIRQYDIKKDVESRAKSMLMSGIEMPTIIPPL